MYRIFILLAVIWPLSATAELQYKCAIEGEIVEMGAGEFHAQAPDGHGGTRDMVIKFTEISLRIDKINNITEADLYCKNNLLATVGKYGLCEDINVYKGDYLRSNLESWNYSDGCISEVDVLKRIYIEGQDD